MNELDKFFFIALNFLAGQNQWFDWLIIFSAKYLGWFMLAGWLFYLWRRPLWRPTRPGAEKMMEAVFVLSSAAFAWIAASGMKLWFAVLRPASALEAVSQLLSADGASFPSSHAAILLALALAVYRFRPDLGKVLVAGALVVGLARVIAGAHWPSDVLAGWILAGLVEKIVFVVYTSLIFKNPRPRV